MNQPVDPGFVLGCFGGLALVLLSLVLLIDMARNRWRR